jgi:hypothetical protein
LRLPNLPQRYRRSLGQVRFIKQRHRSNLFRKLAFTQVYSGFFMETGFRYISDASKVAD